MKTIEEIIDRQETVKYTGDPSVTVSSLCFDSRRISPGAAFFAVKGTASDGHDHIGAAVEAGAVAVVCEREPAERQPVTVVVVKDCASALGRAAAAFYDHPSAKLKLVGVTGTNGKTTTATLLYHLSRKLGYEAGLISTVSYRVGEKVYPSTHTTPDPIVLNDMLSRMAGAGCQYCFMEVSSHSVVQERIAGLHFAGGVFTNITRDHLDYHGTFAEYIKAKKGFFDALPQGSFALVNRDDRNGEVMVQNTRAGIYTYSLRDQADFRCRIKELHLDGMLLEVNGSEIWTHLTGKFNSYNLLSVYAVARLLGHEKAEVLTALSDLRPVDGRFEIIRSHDGVTAIVDYAHTPDALKNVVDTINEIRQGAGRLMVVAGCGGDRDPGKRPQMGRIAAEGSDLAILTSDNPRTESPASILEQMRSGVSPADRVLVIVDRREAIRTAVAVAATGDVILVAGKGHETYQEINGVRNHFDDREEVGKCFEERKLHNPTE